MANITRIFGEIYDRPTIIEGISTPDWTFSVSVGSPYDGTGPIVTRIEIGRGCGIGDFYDKLIAYCGDAPVFEVPAWFAHIEYEHDKNATEAPMF